MSSSPKTAAASAANPAMTKDAPAYAVQEERTHRNIVAHYVEEWLLVPKALYFMLNCVIYATHAFLMQFAMKEWGITKAEFSWTNFAQFTNILGSYVFSRIADKTGNYRLILSGCIAAYCFFVCLIMFPPGFPAPFNLLYYLLLNAIAFFFTAGTFPLLDSMVMSKLASNPKLSREIFGRQRLWGTVGHCLIGLLVHKFAVMFGETNAKGEHLENFSVMFPILIGASIVFIAIVYFGVPRDLKIEAHSHGHGHGHGGHGKANEAASPVAGPKPSPKALLLNPNFSFLLITVFVAGFVRGTITTYQSGYITTELRYDAGVVTKSIFARVFPETTLYFFSKELTQVFGIHWVLLFGHAAGVIRMFGYTMITPADVEPGKTKQPEFWTSAIIYALECLKGVNSSLVISSAARIASDIAPKGLASTAQGYVSGVWQGISMAASSFVGYFLVKWFESMSANAGIKNNFLVCSFAGAVCTVLIFLKFAFIDRVLLARPASKVQA